MESLVPVLFQNKDMWHVLPEMTIPEKTPFSETENVLL